MLSLLILKLDNFSQKLLFDIKICIILTWKRLFGWKLFFSTKIMLLWTKNSSFCEKLSKFCINRANKNKAQMWFWRLASNYVWGCSRGNVWLIWLKFSDNMGIILVFIWYSHQKFLRPPSSPQTAHLKYLKTYWLPCTYSDFTKNFQHTYFFI